MTAIDYDALLAEFDDCCDGRDYINWSAQAYAAIRALRAALAESERDAARWNAVLVIAFDDNSPMTLAADVLPEAKTKEEFTANTDKAMAAQEKANG